jgi:hypothetical protein
MWLIILRAAKTIVLVFALMKIRRINTAATSDP